MYLYRNKAKPRLEDNQSHLLGRCVLRIRKSDVEHSLSQRLGQATAVTSEALSISWWAGCPRVPLNTRMPMVWLQKAWSCSLEEPWFARSYPLHLACLPLWEGKDNADHLSVNIHSNTILGSCCNLLYVLTHILKKLVSSLSTTLPSHGHAE